MSRALLLLAFAAPAFADDTIRLAIGVKIERDVGFAIGVVCDHPDIVTAEMKTAASGKSNILLLTGKRAGKTTCRAGTDPNRVSYVFDVVVTAPKRAPGSGASRSGSRAD